MVVALSVVGWVLHAGIRMTINLPGTQCYLAMHDIHFIRVSTHASFPSDWMWCLCLDPHCFWLFMCDHSGQQCCVKDVSSISISKWSPSLERSGVKHTHTYSNFNVNKTLNTFAWGRKVFQSLLKYQVSTAHKSNQLTFACFWIFINLGPNNWITAVAFSSGKKFKARSAPFDQLFSKILQEFHFYYNILDKPIVFTILVFQIHSNAKYSKKSCRQ